MHLRVYNGEKFERSKWWYVGFAVILICIIILSLVKKNIVGVVVLFFILGAYFYYSIIANQVIKMTINSNHLLVDKKAFPRNTFIGYVLEIDKKSQKIKNIVFISNKSHNIYTIDDKNENIKNFSIELDNYIPMLGDFDQSFFEKTSRILKL